MDLGYPKPISAGFPGVPDNFDTAFVWSGNGKIYFFKGIQVKNVLTTKCNVETINVITVYSSVM